MSGPHRQQRPEAAQRRLARRGRQGRGLGAADRPRHDARPDRRGRGRRHQVRRRRPVPLRSPRQHRRHRRRAQGAGRQGRVARPGDRLGRRPGLAADRRRLGDGRGRRADEVPRAGPQGLPDRQAAPRAGRPALRRRPDRLGLRARRLGRATPTGNQAKIAETFKQAAAIAKDHGERLAAEGEICWGGMHSWRTMVDLLERVGEPETVGFQADMAHTLLYTLGENAPEDRILPDGLRLERPRHARRRPCGR